MDAKPRRPSRGGVAFWEPQGGADFGRRIAGASTGGLSYYFDLNPDLSQNTPTLVAEGHGEKRPHHTHCHKTCQQPSMPAFGWGTSSPARRRAVHGFGSRTTIPILSVFRSAVRPGNIAMLTRNLSLRFDLPFPSFGAMNCYDREQPIRRVMVSPRDSHIIELWLQRLASPHTRGCYRLDAARLLAQVSKPLSRLTLGDLQGFAQSLVEAGLAPISRARTLAAVRSLFGFCQRMRYVHANPVAELALPCYEKRLAERIVGEDDVHWLVEADANPRSGAVTAALCRRIASFGGLWAPLVQRSSARGRRPDYGVRQERPNAGR
jgi:hypothetical protein